MPRSAGRVASLWGEVRGELAQRVPSAVERLRAPAAPRDLARLDSLYGPLPEQLLELLRQCDGEDEVGGGALGGYELLGVDRIVWEATRLAAIRSESNDERDSADTSLPWAANSADLILIDRSTGAVCARDHEIGASTLVAECIAGLLSIYLGELRADLWVDGPEGIAHREEVWIGQWSLEPLPEDPCECLRRMAETFRREPTEDELAGLRRLPPARLLEAASVLLDEYAAKAAEARQGRRPDTSRVNPWAAASTTLMSACRAAGPAAAPWLRARWHALDDLDPDTCIRAAGRVLQESEALELALRVMRETRSAPTVLEHVAGPALLAWIEANPPSPTLPGWGVAVAACSPTWDRLRDWLARGRPYSLMALDALQEIVAQAEVRGPRHARHVRREGASQGTKAFSSVDELRNALTAYVERDGAARVRQTVEQLLAGLQ